MIRSLTVACCIGFFAMISQGCKSSSEPSGPVGLAIYAGQWQTTEYATTWQISSGGFRYDQQFDTVHYMATVADVGDTLLNITNTYSGPVWHAKYWAFIPNDSAKTLTTPFYHSPVGHIHGTDTLTYSGSYGSSKIYAEMNFISVRQR